MKFEIFSGNQDEVKQDMNTWGEQHPDVKIESITSTTALWTNGYGELRLKIVTTVAYTEQSKGK